MKMPKVGDKIYVDSAFYLSHGADDFHGGIATISEVGKMISGGKSVVYVVVEEQPDTKHNWTQFLSKKQKKLKEEFGDKIAHPCPDYREEFNRWD